MAKFHTCKKSTLFLVVYLRVLLPAAFADEVILHFPAAFHSDSEDFFVNGVNTRHLGKLKGISFNRSTSMTAVDADMRMWVSVAPSSTLNFTVHRTSASPPFLMRFPSASFISTVGTVSDSSETMVLDGVTYHEVVGPDVPGAVEGSSPLMFLGIFGFSSYAVVGGNAQQPNLPSDIQGIIFTWNEPALDDPVVIYAGATSPESEPFALADPEGYVSSELPESYSDIELFDSGLDIKAPFEEWTDSLGIVGPIPSNDSGFWSFEYTLPLPNGHYWQADFSPMLIPNEIVQQGGGMLGFAAGGLYTFQNMFRNFLLVLAYFRSFQAVAQDLMRGS